MTLLSYPNPDLVLDSVKNTALKYAFTHIVLEALRLLHNLMGKWWIDGLTLTQWEQFPDSIKLVYPYKEHLTEQEWRGFLRVWYEPRSNVVIGDHLELRQLYKDYAIQFKDKIDLEGIPI